MRMDESAHEEDEDQDNVRDEKELERIVADRAHRKDGGECECDEPNSTGDHPTVREVEPFRESAAMIS